jgi:hypothetical protein
MTRLLRQSEKYPWYKYRQAVCEKLGKRPRALPHPTDALTLPEVTDPTDKRILEWVTQDPDLEDREIGQRLGGMSRQAANTRRKRLEAMGYKVR